MEMLEYSLSIITIQQIQVFLSVAATRNFTRSAIELSMTQPGISKSISTLETILNFKLFERTPRVVSLTKEGLLLYDRWKHLLDIVQNGYHEALNANEQSHSQLNIGITNTTDSNTYFWPIAKEFINRYPHIRLNVEEDDMKALQNNLWDGNYDLIFIPDFEQYGLNTKKLSWIYAAKSNVQIIVPTSSSLHDKKSVTMDDIIDKPITALDPTVNPNFLYAIHELYRPYNAEPIVGSLYKSNFKIRYAQVIDSSIHITDNFWDYHSDGTSVKIPLEDHFNGIICVWNKTDQKSAALRLINLIKSFGFTD